MPRRIGVQKGSVMSKHITPTLWLRLLRRKRAIALGRYPSVLAALSMRSLVATAMYRASGALLRTIETVAGETPHCFATSRMVIVRSFARDRFNGSPLRWRSKSTLHALLLLRHLK